MHQALQPPPRVHTIGMEVCCGLRMTDAPETLRAALAFSLGVAGLWLGQLVWILGSEAGYAKSPNAVTCLWIAGYVYFSLNTCLSFCLNLWGALLTRPRLLPELAVAPQCRVALLCPIYKEDPDKLAIRIEIILRGNFNPGLDLWVLSDSPPDREERESRVVEKLRAAFPDRGDRLHYRRRANNTDKKPGNISEFLFNHGGFQYDYLLVMDNDSLLPAGMIERMVRKAEHPANRKVFLFQAQMKVYHAQTRWARFAQIGTDLGNRLHFRSLFYCQAPSWGHNCLIRTDVLFRLYHYVEESKGKRGGRPAFRPLPTQELSHDIFDFTYASMLGYSVQYVHDIQSFEEAPETTDVNFARSQRWARGSLSAMKLIFEPRASVYARFLVWYGGVSFLNSLFLFWLLLSLWLSANSQYMDISFTSDVVLGPVEANSALLAACLLSVLAYFVLPFCAASRQMPVGKIAWHLMISNLVLMQELTNGVYVLGKTLIGAKQDWTPMGAGSSGKSVCWPTGVPCVVISALALLMLLSGPSLHWWALLAVPVLLGGIFSPLVATYLNSKPATTSTQATQS